MNGSNHEFRAHTGLKKLLAVEGVEPNAVFAQPVLANGRCVTVYYYFRCINLELKITSFVSLVERK